jgi:hypothetical protein
MKKMFLGLLVVASVAAAQGPRPDFPPWAKFGKDLVTTKGFWTIHQDKKQRRFYVEVHGRALSQPFLLATSIAGGSTQRGWQMRDFYLSWKVHDKKLVLMDRDVGYVVKGKRELTEAVKQTYTERMLASYPVLARGPNGGYVIDGKSFFARGASQFFGGSGRSRDSSLAKFRARTFENNAEISVTQPNSRGYMTTLHYSVSYLPKNTGYRPRKADDRVGYFLTVLKDFSETNKDDRRMLRYINRWHLQKADPKLEVSPPKEPIIFYIEKTVPVKMRRYVRDGILEWNKAFEKVGYDQAIIVRQQTSTQYNELDPEDVRYNFFRWIYSESAFAMGPSRVHPETGQILDADIIFDDEYIRYTLQDYRVQIRELPKAMTGGRGARMLKGHPFARLGMVPAPDEFADAVPEDAGLPVLPPWKRRAFCSLGNGVKHQVACCALHLKVKPGDPIPEELLGQFVKDTVMHEVGHTLGLRHNFKASIYRSLDEIHSEAKPGDITGSVMDYNPLAIAPEGKPQGSWAMRTIGPYDLWAIEYGYTAKDKDLAKVVSRVAEKGLDYATDEDTWSDDPYVARWDLGSDPLSYAKSRIAHMKKLRKDLEARAVDKGERYNRLRRAMNMQLYAARSAGSTAVRYVGGEHMHRDHRGDPNARPPLVPVSAKEQRAALAFVCDEILSGNYFDFSPELLSKLAPDFWGDDWLAMLFEGHGYPYLDNVLRVQFSQVYGLTSPGRLTRVIDARHKTKAGEDVLTAPDIFDSLHNTIFGSIGDVANRKSTNQMPALNDMQRNLQREYVSHLIYILLEGEGWYPASIQTLSRFYVKKLKNDLGKALENGKGLDTYTKAHLDECYERLHRSLEASYAITK